MPEKIAPAHFVTSGHDIVLQRPALAAQALNVCANWALIEHNLTVLYSLLMGKYVEAPRGFEPPIHPVARQIFDTLNNLGARLDLLLRLARWCAPPEMAEKIERDIIPKLWKRFTERSEIAHGVWGVCNDYPDALILVREFDGNLVYKEHDFKQASQRMVELHSRIGSEIIRPLYEKFRQERGSDPEIARQFFETKK